MSGSLSVSFFCYGTRVDLDHGSTTGEAKETTFGIWSIEMKGSVSVGIDMSPTAGILDRSSSSDVTASTSLSLFRVQ